MNTLVDTYLILHLNKFTCGELYHVDRKFYSILNREMCRCNDISCSKLHCELLCFVDNYPLHIKTKNPFYYNNIDAIQEGNICLLHDMNSLKQFYWYFPIVFNYNQITTNEFERTGQIPDKYLSTVYKLSVKYLQYGRDIMIQLQDGICVPRRYTSHFMRFMVKTQRTISFFDATPPRVPRYGQVCKLLDPLGPYAHINYIETSNCNAIDGICQALNSTVALHNIRHLKYTGTHRVLGLARAINLCSISAPRCTVFPPRTAKFLNCNIARFNTCHYEIRHLFAYSVVGRPTLPHLVSLYTEYSVAEFLPRTKYLFTSFKNGDIYEKFIGAGIVPEFLYIKSYATSTGRVVQWKCRETASKMNTSDIKPPGWFILQRGGVTELVSGRCIFGNLDFYNVITKYTNVFLELLKQYIE